MRLNVGKPLPRSCIGVLAALATAPLQTAAIADFPKPEKEFITKPYPGIEWTARYYRLPRPLRVWIVRIDSTQANLGFDFTQPKRIQPGFETTSSTTLAFARERKTELAMNASAFAPIRLLSGQGVGINGLAATAGHVYSPPEPAYEAFTIDSTGKFAILSAAEQRAALPTLRDAIAGFKIILRDGKNLYDLEPATRAATIRHPRTAIGLSKDRRTVFWFVVDGRQPKVSEGVSLSELAQLAKDAGAADVLNLDGGGSTTLVLRDPSSRNWNVVNVPVGVKNVPNSLRQNGNAIGLQVFGIDGDVTFEQLKTLGLAQDGTAVREWLGSLNRALFEFNIIGIQRRAGFVAALAQDTKDLCAWPILSHRLFENGKAKAAGTALGVELVEHSAQSKRPDLLIRWAAWQWHAQKLNELADRCAWAQIGRVRKLRSSELADYERRCQAALATLLDVRSVILLGLPN